MRYFLNHERIVDNETGDTMALIANPDTGDVIDWPVMTEDGVTEAHRRAEEFAVRLIGLLNQQDA
jgi:hypothetical protein